MVHAAADVVSLSLLSPVTKRKDSSGTSDARRAGRTRLTRSFFFAPSVSLPLLSQAYPEEYLREKQKVCSLSQSSIVLLPSRPSSPAPLSPSCRLVQDFLEAGREVDFISVQGAPQCVFSSPLFFLPSQADTTPTTSSFLPSASPTSLTQNSSSLFPPLPLSLLLPPLPFLPSPLTKNFFTTSESLVPSQNQPPPLQIRLQSNRPRRVQRRTQRRLALPRETLGDRFGAWRGG